MNGASTQQQLTQQMDEQSQPLIGNQQQTNNNRQPPDEGDPATNGMTEEQQAMYYQRLAIRRQRQMFMDRRNNNTESIRNTMRQTNQQTQQIQSHNFNNTIVEEGDGDRRQTQSDEPGAQGELAPPADSPEEEAKEEEAEAIFDPTLPGVPRSAIGNGPERAPPAPAARGGRAGNGRNPPQQQNQSFQSHGSLGLSMSFADMWTSITEEEEKKVTQEFIMDMLLLIISLFILEMIRESDPKGCGIPIREWLMVFCCLYFTRSTFQLIKIYVIRYINSYKLYYDVFAFVLCNGAMIVWLYYGYDIFYSDQNDCDSVPDTAFLASIMFVILFIGYFMAFIYLTIICTVPCLYMMIREQAEQNRVQSGGVGQAQVPMILASLTRTQYDPQMFQHETQCIICLVEYEQTDIVTQLRCDERHYFHHACLEGWVKGGNNRCPFCRAPILTFGSGNEDEESLVSSQDAEHQHGHRNERVGAVQNRNRGRTS